MSSSQQQPAWLTLRHDTSFAGRLSAIGEPIAIILAATVAARVVMDVIGTPDADLFLFEQTPPDFVAAAKSEAVWHGLRYGLIFGFAVLIGWWRMRPLGTSYGLSTGHMSISALAGIGVALALIGSLPLQVLHIMHRHVQLGSDTRFWELRDQVPWDFGFWIYMAVGSFLLVPIVEELVARGYVLGRLREAFSAGASLVLMSVLFALAHGQYHRLEILAIGQNISLTLFSFVLGYSVYRTGSLIPAIVAHCLINAPMELGWRYAALAMSLAASLLLWRQIRAWVAQIAQLLGTVDDWPALSAALAFVAAALLTLRLAPWAPFAWLGLFLILLALGLGRRSVWSRGQLQGY